MTRGYIGERTERGGIWTPGAVDLAIRRGGYRNVPANGLVMRFSYDAGLTLNASGVTQWVDTVSGVVMTSQTGTPPLLTSEGVLVDYDRFFQTSNTIPSFKAFAAIAKMNTVASGQGSQFCLLADSATYAYHGFPATDGSGAALVNSFSSTSVQEASVYSSTNTYMGTASGVSRALLWGTQDVVILTSTNTLPSFNRFGRDRTTHSYNGYIKEILFYDVDLRVDADLRGNVIAYLNSRM